MERFDDDLTLTTSQAGDLLSVHPSTVKRWSDGGRLPARRTGGGHRRIHLRDVLDAASERGIETYLDPFAPFESHVWSAVTEAETRGAFRKAHSLAMGWLMRGCTERVGRLFTELGRRPTVPLALFCDGGVRPLLRRAGDARRHGRIGAGEERIAGRVLMEALLRLREHGRAEARSRGDRVGLTAVVGSVEGDPHSVDALCVRLVMERRGWTALDLGAGVAAEDLASALRSREADLACIAGSDLDVARGLARRLRTLPRGGAPPRCWVLLPGADDGGASGPSAGADGSGIACFSTVAALDAALEAAATRGARGARPRASGTASVTELAGAPAGRSGP